MAAKKQPAPRHRLLIVDDEESVRLLMARYATKALKAEVQLAGTCEQALMLAHNYAYDAILLDLMMPGIGGYEVLKEIRAGSANTATPILIISALEDMTTNDRCLAAGASGFLVKPVDQRALEIAVTSLLAGRGKPKTN
ncbi:MAG: response regulator [Betaproteobacteria bacterium]|nr:response regulator [Betaproteobacteria bacterium]MDH4322597.1 response regulator [Betaproteobacteria bacterium]MDH5576836.1 response regulator [Betaproteobacteria bacterium]